MYDPNIYLSIYVLSILWLILSLSISNLIIKYKEGHDTIVALVSSSFIPIVGTILAVISTLIMVLGLILCFSRFIARNIT